MYLRIIYLFTLRVQELGKVNKQIIWKSNIEYHVFE